MNNADKMQQLDLTMTNDVMAQQLKQGDKLCTGETITSVRMAGLDLPAAKCAITIETKRGILLTKVWNKRTLINVERIGE